MNLLRISKLIFLLMILTNSVYAQQAFLKNDPNRPVDKISKALGITSEQFILCFNNVKPVARGTNPTREREMSNKKILLSCLQDANENITNKKLDEIMDRYRPEGKLHP